MSEAEGNEVGAIIAPWVFFAMAVYIYLQNHDIALASFLSILGIGLAVYTIYLLNRNNIKRSNNQIYQLTWISLLSIIANILTIISFILDFILK